VFLCWFDSGCQFITVHLVYAFPSTAMSSVRTEFSLTFSVCVVAQHSSMHQAFLVLYSALLSGP